MRKYTSMYLGLNGKRDTVIRIEVGPSGRHAFRSISIFCKPTVTRCVVKPPLHPIDLRQDWLWPRWHINNATRIRFTEIRTEVTRITKEEVHPAIVFEWPSDVRSCHATGDATELHTSMSAGDCSVLDTSQLADACRRE